MSKSDSPRADWLVENAFTVLALMATAVSLFVTAAHVSQLSKEVWVRPNVAALETFQLVDQVLSLGILATVLALGVRGTVGITLRLFCALMSAASAYAELFVMTAEHTTGPEAFWEPFTIIMTMGSAAMLETMAGMMDSLEPVERV